ncbi:MAG: metal-dependent hydrolase [Gammaproteobacteria bacterium]|nr:MAG: metal-dependent hydrolase [Gammaproteobacteria bacterium]
MNTIGFKTLLRKELLRFWKVAFQTIFAPVITTLLYLVVFSQALDSRVSVFHGIEYAVFLVPGLVIMAVLQNAFANSSSSLTQAKITGHIILILLPPLSHLELYMAYTIAAMVRGMVVGLGVLIAATLFIQIPVHNFGFLFIFALASSAVLGSIGMIAGIWADKFDQLALFQNFIIMPLTFLSGVFYSIQSLPAFWQFISHLNPIFYMVDGFRYGFLGVSDVSPWYSLTFVIVAMIGCTALTLTLLKSGYKLRH